MEMRQLEYFIKIVEMGGITAAADTLGITQPNLSRQLRALEHEWGWKLFERSGRGMTLTPKGEVSYREMLKVRRVLENSLKTMHRINGRRRLRVGYAPSLTSQVLQRTLDQYRTQYPAVEISLHDVSSAEMEEGIATAKLDLVLGAEFESDSIKWSPMYRYEHVVAFRKDHPFASRAELSSADLDQERLLMFSRHDYLPYWEKLTHYFEQKGINAKIAGEFDGIESLLTALRAGLGIAILTRSACDFASKNLVFKELSDKLPVIQVSAGQANYREAETELVVFVNLLLDKVSSDEIV